MAFLTSGLLQGREGGGADGVRRCFAGQPQAEEDALGGRILDAHLGSAANSHLLRFHAEQRQSPRPLSVDINF